MIAETSCKNDLSLFIFPNIFALIFSLISVTICILKIYQNHPHGEYLSYHQFRRWFKSAACILKLFPPLFPSSHIRSLLIVKKACSTLSWSASLDTSFFLRFRFSAGLRKLFWALFDKTDLEAFELESSTFYITQTTGETLFAIFNIVAILISLNMLIAMMSNSFQQIAVSNSFIVPKTILFI